MSKIRVVSDEFHECLSCDLYHMSYDHSCQILWSVEYKMSSEEDEIIFVSRPNVMGQWTVNKINVVI